MAVAVQEYIDSRSVGDHIRIGPGPAFFFISQVGHGKYEIGALFPGGIHRSLHGLVDLLSGFIHHEAVYIIPFIVHEIGRCGAANRQRRRHAYESNLLSGRFQDDIGLKDRFVLIGEVAADIGELRFPSQLQETVRSVVEFMVAGYGHVIADGIHQIDDVFSLANGADGLSLDRISVVYKDGLIALCLQGISDLCKARISKTLVHTAVDVAGAENIDLPVFLCLGLLGFLRFFSFGSFPGFLSPGLRLLSGRLSGLVCLSRGRAGRHGKHQNEGQKKCQSVTSFFSHGTPPLNVFWYLNGPLHQTDA